jgi:hypothetical protein
VTCYNCQEMGHIATYCTNKPVCRICKSTNHKAYNCDGSGPGGITQPQQQNQGATKVEGATTTQTTQYVLPALGGRAGTRVSFQQGGANNTAQTGQGM